MNSLVIILIAVVVLGAGYLGYGRWLAKKWGIDANAKTPAVANEDGKDYVPSSKLTVFAHQFSSIAGAGPVQGPIIAAMFGWVPVLLWLLVGGVFFGAVQDFGSLYASVKNEGKSIGLVIEKYIGKAGRRFFSLFCWLFTLLVIAAFTSMVSSTFNGFTTGADGAVTKNFNGAAAATVSMLFIVVAMVLGVVMKTCKNMKEWVKAIVAIVLIVAMFAVGMKLPWYLNGNQWNYVIMAYLFLASVLPMWLLMQPRDYMTTFMLVGMLVGAFVGVLVGHPDMGLNAFNGFTVVSSTGAKSYLFPTLFVTIACGAVSGFHSLVSSGTASKQIKNEKNMLPVSFGAMLMESMLAIIALIAVASFADGEAAAQGLTTQPQIFAGAIANFLSVVGLPHSLVFTLINLAVSAFALTSLDSVARVGRLSFQEFFLDSDTDEENMSPFLKVVTNKYFATVITLVLAYMLTKVGYAEIWPLFGSANQLLSVLALVACAVFLKKTKRQGCILWIPMVFMMAVTFTALGMTITKLSKALLSTGLDLGNTLQLVFAVLLLILGVLVAIQGVKKLLEKQEA